MKVGMVVRRFLVPSTVKTLIYVIRCRALISPRAEVDLSSNLSLGKGTEIAAFTKVKATDGPVSLGRDCSVGPGCFISSGTAGIKIGDNVMIAANTSIVANNHRYDSIDKPMNKQGHTSLGIVIEDDVWIGSNCAVVDGSHIETGAVIAAGSVVSGRIAKRKIAVGNPAKAIFERR